MTGPDSRPSTKRLVAVIDDDDWSRWGLSDIFGSDPEMELVAALTHEEALSSDDWLRADVAIVDAADDRRSDDQFPGVSVVERVRARTGDQMTVIVVTGHFWDSAVRQRMREAGADLLYYRPEVQDAERIRAIVANPDLESRGVPAPEDPEELFRIGIGQSTKVNRFVESARAFGWLGAELSHKGRRPRAFDRQRKEASASAQVHAVNADGTPPDRDQDVPGRPQLAKLLDWATRVPNQRRSSR